MDASVRGRNVGRRNRPEGMLARIIEKGGLAVDEWPSARKSVQAIRVIDELPEAVYDADEHYNHECLADPFRERPIRALDLAAGDGRFSRLGVRLVGAVVRRRADEERGARGVCGIIVGRRGLVWRGRRRELICGVLVPWRRGRLAVGVLRLLVTRACGWCLPG